MSLTNEDVDLGPFLHFSRAGPPGAQSGLPRHICACQQGKRLIPIFDRLVEHGVYLVYNCRSRQGRQAGRRGGGGVGGVRDRVGEHGECWLSVASMLCVKVAKAGALNSGPVSLLKKVSASYVLINSGHLWRSSFSASPVLL